MPAIPLGRMAFQRSGVPVQTLKNYAYETAPTSLEDNVSLRPRWRLQSFATAGSGPINGLYRKDGVMSAVGNAGAILALSGTTLYKVDQNTGASSALGTVTGSFSRMSAEGDANVVVLTTGGTLYKTDGASLSTITLPDTDIAYAVDTLNGYFLVCSDSGRFYWTSVGGTTIDALDYATAESQPDDLLTLKVIGDELWLFGRSSIEVWQPTGDLNLPFQRITGRVFGIGITARDTCQKLNVGGMDTVCWVGTDRRVYRTNPNPVRISDPSIEEKLRDVPLSATDNTVNPYATTASFDGHDFYILHIPGEGSWVYDLSTGLWDEWTSYARSFFRGAVGCVGVNAQPLLGDDGSGVIWKLTDQASQDGTDPVVFQGSGLLEVVGDPVPCRNVQMTVSTGGTDDPDADPVIQLAVSRDAGATFGDEIQAPLGRMGERRQRVIWTRLGMLRSPNVAFRWRTTEPVIVRKLKYNESLR